MHVYSSYVDTSMRATVDENGHTENMLKASFALCTVLTNQAKWPVLSEAVDENVQKEIMFIVSLVLYALLTKPAKWPSSLKAVDENFHTKYLNFENFVN